MRFLETMNVFQLCNDFSLLREQRLIEVIYPVVCLLLQHARRKRKAHAQCTRCSQLHVQSRAMNKSSRQAAALYFCSSLTMCLRRVPSRHCAQQNQKRDEYICYPQPGVPMWLCSPSARSRAVPALSLEGDAAASSTGRSDGCFFPRASLSHAIPGISKECNLLLHSCLIANNVLLNNS